MKLTSSERMVLWNQYEILKRLDPSNADGFERYQEILEQGYSLLYGELSPAVVESEVSENACDEVVAILEMYSAFSRSLRGGPAPHHWAEFQGFDGAHESPQYRFAKFLRRKQGKWPELRDRPDDSQHATMGQYRDMLRAWKALGQKPQLTAAEIQEICRGSISREPSYLTPP